MYKWEDEKWDKVNLQAGYSRNDRRCMETYLTIPADKGKFHVYLEADGEFVVKHIGGDLDGSWLGNIAYDVSQRGWTVGNYKGCKIKNFQTNTTFVAGHPDAKMNGKTFDSARAVEVDWFASFELECDDEEGSWMIYPPPIQKDASYNYTVSYGNYTEKYCEWGAISVSIDEDNEGYAPRRIPRKGEMAWSDPERDYSENKLQKENWNTEPLDAGETLREGKPDTNPSSDIRVKLNYSLSLEDSEDELIDEPNFVPGKRMNLEAIPLHNPASKDYILRDRGIATTLVEPAYLQGVAPQNKIEEDPWKHVRDFKSSHTSKNPASVASGSTLRGNLRGRSMPPPLPPPAEKVGDSLLTSSTQWDPPGSPLTPFKDKELAKPPSDARSSISSRLTGGLLKSRVDKDLANLTTAQRQQYEMTRQNLGKTAAQKFLQSCKEGGL